MKLIVITSPEFLPGETELMQAMLEEGLDRIHLRKPGCTAAELAALIERFPAPFRPRITLHDHFPLQRTYGLGGVHLNGRNPDLPDGYRGTVSRSCHSLEEVATHRTATDYLFLSPVSTASRNRGTAPPSRPQRCAKRLPRELSTKRCWLSEVYRKRICRRCAITVSEAPPSSATSGHASARRPTPQRYSATSDTCCKPPADPLPVLFPPASESASRLPRPDTSPYADSPTLRPGRTVPEHEAFPRHANRHCATRPPTSLPAPRTIRFPPRTAKAKSLPPRTPPAPCFTPSHLSAACTIRKKEAARLFWRAANTRTPQGITFSDRRLSRRPPFCPT